MSVYVIADLHLSIGKNKSMEVFGYRWQNYTEKIERAWRDTVTDADTVVIPGDVSWGMSLAEAEADLRFVDSLPGRKIIGKGNHDYWWQTMKKLTAFREEKGLTSLSFLYNNAYAADGITICGSRGWWNEEKTSPDDVDYRKIVSREAQRIRLSLDAAASQFPDTDPDVFLHFPPVLGDMLCPEILAVLKEKAVRSVYFGHLHGRYDLPPAFVHDGITYTLCSADYLNFTPLRVTE